MPALSLHFSTSLAVFNRRLKNGRPVTVTFGEGASIKHIIESAGVPHTEIGRIEVENQPVGFTYVPLVDGPVTVASIAPPFDPTRPSLLRPRSLDTLRYVADVNVGKLAVLMRMVGLDTDYENALSDDDIAAKAENERRIVLTKDRGLLKRRRVLYGRYIRSVHPDDQLREVIGFFGLAGRLRPFTRCIRCNAELDTVPKAAISHRLLPKTKKYFNHFKQCGKCGRTYWRGSHHARMREQLHTLGVIIDESRKTTIF